MIFVDYKTHIIAMIKVLNENCTIKLFLTAKKGAFYHNLFTFPGTVSVSQVKSHVGHILFNSGEMKDFN